MRAPRRTSARVAPVPAVVALALALLAPACGSDELPPVPTVDLASSADLAPPPTTCRTDADCGRTDAGTPGVCCGGLCRDTSRDTSNCGACGKLCPIPAHATAACVNGTCGIGSCDLAPGWYTDCDKDPANGCEVDVLHDANNCAGCGITCKVSAPHRAPSCESGKCALECERGWGDCNNQEPDGCEVNVDSDPLHCGGCGRRCAGLPNATSTCMAGVCSILSCTAGFSDCDKSAANGCEADLGADPLNCGACHVACAGVANGKPGCSGGACGVGACDLGFGDCDGNPANGCETKVASDAKNCGACGVACAGANSAQSCDGGVCKVTSCNPGYSDCDGMPANGCEAATASDVMNCGGCGKACDPVANGTVVCTNSMCAFTGCKFGFADCNGDPKDGCEADLLGPANCGKCGNACPAPPNATAGCVLAKCGVGTCKPGWGDCNKNPADGCEKPVDSDVMNCGACGKVCGAPNAVMGCLAGQCGLLGCQPDWADCDGNLANGCETYVSGSAKNCGKCGNACGNGLSCSNGQCVVLYQPVGPQTNVAIANLVGWSQCFLDLYGDGMTPSLAQVQAGCPKAKLLLACRPTGAQTLQLLAWAPRADVLFDVGNVYDSTTSHSANGSAWYYSNALSWGFAKDGDPIKRGSCDYRASVLDATGGNGNLRLCWHTGANNLNGGWRCGTNDTLNASPNYERLIYQAD